MDITLTRIVGLMLAGAMGTLARYGMQVAAHRRGLASAWATGAVNLLGCLAFGLIVGLLESRIRAGGELRVVVLTGFLGAFTTFSALIGDSAVMSRDGAVGLALANLVAQVALGSALLALGLLAGRAM